MSTIPNVMPNAMTVAGSDSGGGAGIQADLKTFASLRVYGTSVITALTAQNGLGVTGIHAPPADFVALQLTAVLDGFPLQAAKTGMLFNAEIIDVVAQKLAARGFPLVVDPVCVSQSGHSLVTEDAMDAMKKMLFPQADLITPNRPETEALTGIHLTDVHSVKEAGRILLATGAKAVLIKGGHYEDTPILVTDWYIEYGKDPVPFRQPHVDTRNNHGTGCTLSAAIVAYLAKKTPMKIAISKAQEYLNCALRHSYAPGKGTGPVHHLSTLDELT